MSGISNEIKRLPRRLFTVGDVVKYECQGDGDIPLWNLGVQLEKDSETNLRTARVVFSSTAYFRIDWRTGFTPWLYPQTTKHVQIENRIDVREFNGSPEEAIDELTSVLREGVSELKQLREYADLMYQRWRNG